MAGAVRALLGPLVDVQEVLQEAFLRAWQARSSFAKARDPRAWVFVLTMNLARDLRRKAGRRGQASSLAESGAMEMATRDAGPGDQAEQSEALILARAAIASLSESEKEVFLLRTSAGLSFEAVAQALAIPVGTAKSRMRAALQALRLELAGLGLEDERGDQRRNAQ